MIQVKQAASYIKIRLLATSSVLDAAVVELSNRKDAILPYLASEIFREEKIYFAYTGSLFSQTFLGFVTRIVF